MNSAINSPTRYIPAFWRKIIRSGIHKDLEFNEIKKLKIINNISAWIIVFNFLTSIRWVLTGLPQFLVLNLTAVVVMSSVILFNRNEKYQTARYVFFLYIPAHVTILSLFIPLGTEQFLFPLMVTAGFIIKDKKKLIVYLGLLGADYLFLKSGFGFHDITHMGPSYQYFFLMLSTVLCIVLIFLSISVFIKQYAENRDEILIKNEILAESVKIAKEKSDYTSLLFKEMNHRVKNNLQLISSLLNIHADQLKDKNAKKAMIGAKNRIHSIAILHKQLYTGGNLTNIDLTTYIDDLILHIRDMLPEIKRNTQLNFYSDPFSLRVEDAVNVGLIINELVTNAIIHGVSINGEKTIFLNIVKREDDMLTISVADSGSGINLKYFAENKGFGFELIETLYQKYNGNLAVDESKNEITVTLFLRDKRDNNVL